MSQYHAITKRAIDANGQAATYTVVTEGAYDIETSKTTNTETNHSVTLYRKNIKVTPYNYPHLIRKDVSEFYLCNHGLSFSPQLMDFITYSGDKYIIDSIRSHEAAGSIVLYKLLAYKG